MPELLEGTTGLVVGVANKRSIAWAIARKLDEAGQRLVLTYQGERMKGEVRSWPSSSPMCRRPALDVQDDARYGRFRLVRGPEGRSTLVHSVAYARPKDLGGSFAQTSREAFHWPTCRPTRRPVAGEASPRCPMPAASTMTRYLGADRVVPGYNVMGVAKPASRPRALPRVGPRRERIRVNCISAGPVHTLAARGIPGFGTMADTIAGRTPLRREITQDEVADTAVYLASPLSASVTGETIFFR